MTAAKPLRADARRSRDALLVSAREVFAADGFDLRFDDFARLASVGTPYRRFPAREALTEAVYREELTAIWARDLQAVLPPAEALAAFLRGFVSDLDAYQGLARTLATLIATRLGVLAEGGQALGQAIADLLAAAVRDGTIHDDIGVGAVMVALQGICSAFDYPGCQTDADGIITLVLTGLGRDRS